MKESCYGRQWKRKTTAASFDENEQQYLANKRMLNDRLELLTITNYPKCNENDGTQSSKVDSDHNVEEEDNDQEESDKIQHHDDEITHNRKPSLSDSDTDNSFQSQLQSIGTRRRRSFGYLSSDDEDEDALSHIPGAKVPKTKVFEAELYKRGLVPELTRTTSSLDNCLQSAYIREGRGAYSKSRRECSQKSFKSLLVFHDPQEAFTTSWPVDNLDDGGKTDPEKSPSISSINPGVRSGIHSGDLTHDDWGIEEIHSSSNINDNKSFSSSGEISHVSSAVVVRMVDEDVWEGPFRPLGVSSALKAVLKPCPQNHSLPLSLNPSSPSLSVFGNAISSARTAAGFGYRHLTTFDGYPTASSAYMEDCAEGENPALEWNVDGTVNQYSSGGFDDGEDGAEQMEMSNYE